MNDLISRRAAIKAIDDLPNCYNGYSDTYDKAYIIGVLEELPSVDVPDRKVGEWETEVRTIRGHKIQFFACSVCGRNADGEYPYCPNCGAKMERSEDDPKG